MHVNVCVINKFADKAIIVTLYQCVKRLCGCVCVPSINLTTRSQTIMETQFHKPSPQTPFTWISLQVEVSLTEEQVRCPPPFLGS